MVKTPEQDMEVAIQRLKSIGETPLEKADPVKGEDKKEDDDDELEKALAKYEEDCEKAMPEQLKNFKAKARSKTDKDDVKKAVPTIPDFEAVVEKAIAKASEDVISQKLAEMLDAKFNQFTESQAAGLGLTSKALGKVGDALEGLGVEKALKELRGEIEALKAQPSARISVGNVSSALTQKSLNTEEKQYNFTTLAQIAAQHWGNPSRGLNFADVAERQGIEKALSVYPTFPKNKLNEAMTGVN